MNIEIRHIQLDTYHPCTMTSIWRNNLLSFQRATKGQMFCYIHIPHHLLALGAVYHGNN